MPEAGVEVHGHRGARALFPENTLPAFEYAVSIGVDALELDLAVTRDNVLVVSHDPRMNPAFCTGPAGAANVIREMTYAELQRWDCGGANAAFPRQRAIPGTPVPAFRDVLALARQAAYPVQLNVETKIFAAHPELTPEPEEFVELIYGAVCEAGLLARLILQSFDFRTLQAMKRRDAGVRLSALFEAGESAVVERTLEVGAQIVSPHLSLGTEKMMAQAHKAGLRVIPWTANLPEQWQALTEAGADAVISDDPGALMVFLAHQKKNPGCR